MSRENPSASGNSAHKKKPSILDRLNLGPLMLPDEKVAKGNGGFVDRAPPNPNATDSAPEVGEKSTGERDPKVSRKGPTFEGRADESKWQRLRRSYVEGDRSLRALSDEHCVPYATAKRRAKKEAWAVKRATFRQELDRQLDKAALVSRAQVYEIQEQAARETVAIFARVFAAKAREIRADPAAKNAANGLSRLIQLQLDVCELGLTILGDIELGARAAGYSSPHSSQISLRDTP